MAEQNHPPGHSVTPERFARRRFVAAATTLFLLPVIPRIAKAATILAVRTWPADEYTRVTLEMDSELKAEHFTLDGPHRLVVDIEGLTISQTINELVSKIKPNDPYIAAVRVGQNRPN
ncbi:MAG: AMIN domain-containing protein, partial [Pusillimonas sp.]|nr:AMIN domain-containing protein [Pusillimonas sp.]